VYLKSDLIREVASVEGDKLVYYLSVSEIWSDKRSGSVEGDKLVYYLSVSEIWPDKRGGLC
jgi:hypothetical protein